MEKKGLSPVVATVLLIAMVIVLALIIFLWFRSMAQEAITKFEGQNVELVCDEVVFEASYSSNSLAFQNNGQVPIFQMKVRGGSGGSYSTETLSGWPEKGLNPGKAVSVSYTAAGVSKITLIPVLLGQADSGKKTYVCDNKYGKELSV